MTKGKMIQAINNKVVELSDEIEAIKTNESLAKMTRNTQSSARRREIKVLNFISRLIPEEGIDLTDDDLDVFEMLTALRGTRQGGIQVIVRKGDNVLQLLQKYKDVKDVWTKVMNAGAKAGLTYDASTGSFN